MGRGLYMYGHPFRPEHRRHPAGGTDQPDGAGVRADTDQNPFRGRPDLPDAPIAPVAFHLVVHPLGGAPQRQLPQSNQIALAKKVLPGLFRLFGQIDLAFLQALDEIVGRQIDELDFIGPVQKRVGHGLPDDDAGDLADNVVQALQMLDIDGGINGDAGIEELLDILPPLLVTGPGGIRMGQLIDDDQRRIAA